MKNKPFMTVYGRLNPVADMFVPHQVAISIPTRTAIYRKLIIVTTILTIIAVPALLAGSSTSAYFSDREQSTGDTFAAGPLDFSVASVPPGGPPGTMLVLGEAGETFVLTVTPVSGSLPLRYTVSGSASGDAAFCSAISASGASPLAYNGPAASLVTSDTNDLTPWSLTLTLPSPSQSVVDGMRCNLDLTYRGYQEGGAPGTEYHDTEHVVLNLVADPPPPPPPPVSSSITVPPPPPPPEDSITPPDTVVDPPTDTPPADIAPPSDEIVTPPTDETVDVPAPDAPAQ